ncbi:MAG: polyprenol monophosphomannose synthase [Chitinophagaceae bacterium]|nr:polyprenol monophosphomannose synthase [Chitinophagaceae bacterium]
MEKLVIIPTYNEKENIPVMLKSIMNLSGNFHVLVVDDNSPDGTAESVALVQKEYPERIFLEVRKGKQGLGTAYIHGFKWALARGYDYIFEIDADFSHNPGDLLRLFDACSGNGADVAIGSRYVKNGGVVNWPGNRIILSKGASLYTRILTCMPVKDPTAGFICYKREVLEAIHLDKIPFVGYAFQIAMKYTAWKLGFKLKEVPIIFQDRKYGSSKMNKGIITEGILGVLKLKYLSIFTNYKKRFSAKYSISSSDMVSQKLPDRIFPETNK